MGFMHQVFFCVGVESESSFFVTSMIFQSYEPNVQMRILKLCSEAVKAKEAM